MSLSFFVAEMECPVCHTVSPATNETDMQNQLGTEPWTRFGVGDEVPSTDEDLVASYVRVRPNRDGEPTRLLQFWRCSSCGNDNWAEIEVVEARVRTIAPVAPERRSLARVQWVHELHSEELFLTVDVSDLFDSDEPRPEAWEALARNADLDPR